MSINKKEEEATLPREIDYSWVSAWCQQVDTDIREILIECAYPGEVASVRIPPDSQ